jgi:hypothetical protein
MRSSKAVESTPASSRPVLSGVMPDERPIGTPSPAAEPLAQSRPLELASRECRERDRHLPGYPSKQVHSQRPRAVDAASPSHRAGGTARTSAASRACWWRDGRASSRLPQRRVERLVPPSRRIGLAGCLVACLVLVEHWTGRCTPLPPPSGPAAMVSPCASSSRPI